MKNQEICAEFETAKIAKSISKVLETKKNVTYKDLLLTGRNLTVTLTTKSADMKNQNEIMNVIVEGAGS